ncbi:unnamed protein product [Prorocentrum cordatum]|uniref:RAB6-interacting golgin n=1 Tax=Prorocentrum cordatum TaxID=2364126 RepID=A0ABN9U7P7_9DINO|nr:unnamed protein product [Polarella glacialis]
MLSKQEDKVEELDRLVKTAEKEKEDDSEAEVKRWARKAVVAKKELADAAEKAFYAAESSDTQRVKTRENDLIEELHEMRTEVIPQKTREVWEKYAKVISEAEAKVEKAKADLATASEDLVKKSKADDQVLKKLAAEVKEIEQKKAAMESCPRRHERPWPGTASCRRKPAPRTQKSELGGRPARPDGGSPPPPLHHWPGPLASGACSSIGRASPPPPQWCFPRLNAGVQIAVCTN